MNDPFVDDRFMNDPVVNDWETYERRLDDLVRPSLVVEPSARVRADLLATVLRAADVIDFAPAISPPVVAAPPLGAGLSPLAYAAVAAVVASYLTLVGPVGGSLAEWQWLPVLVQQLGSAAGFVAGTSGEGFVGTLLPGMLERAPWLALVPLLWFLWDRDRSLLRQR